MGVTGKYDFKGIKKFGAKGLLSALGSTPFGALILKWGFGSSIEICFEWFANWLANKGLIVLNVAAIQIEGEWDQKAFDAAMDEALSQVKSGLLTPQQQKEIDDKVIRAFRKFAMLSKPN